MKYRVKRKVKEIIICKNLRCSVEEFRYKVDWNWISYYQRFSEDFMREFKDQYVWGHLRKSQKLSEDFIYGMREYLDFDYYLKENKITQEFINNKIIKIKEIVKKEKIASRFEILDL